MLRAYSLSFSFRLDVLLSPPDLNPTPWLNSLSCRVEQLGYTLEVSDKAKELVATKGYDVQYGARPLKRAIQTYIEDGLCERLLSGELTPGDIIVVDKASSEDELTFTCRHTAEAAPALEEPVGKTKE